VDNTNEVRDFLTTRRSRVTPAEAGITAGAGLRRVPGLRRGEVAELAGVSLEYYARLERGNLRGVSEAVLDAIARALRLDEAERGHLHDLARAAGGRPRAARRAPATQLRPSLRRLIDQMTMVPVLVNDARLDVVAVNPLAEALFAPVLDTTVRPVNHALFTFLDPRADQFWPDWERAADDNVAMLRAAAGRDPYDKRLRELVGELSTRSEDFRRRWAAHDVRQHRTGTKHIHHPEVGDLHLDFDTLEIPGQPGLLLIAFTPAIGSSEDDALRLLSSWAATRQAVSTTGKR
jgi:transcriptional regulator with XRE-family HTH domain